MVQGSADQLSVVPVWLWVVFSVGVVVLLGLDLALFGRDEKAPSTRKALLESATWIALALGFNGWFAATYGGELGLEFLTGYLVEKSLSVDNLFVILLIFRTFAVPAELQHRVLFFGVLGAIVLRGIFIVVGAELLHHVHAVIYVFGAVLVFSGIRFLREGDEAISLEHHRAIRLVRRVIPVIDRYEGHRFFVVVDGVRKATPLFLALVVVEATDLVFAVDSIPAVFAVTQDAFVAFASNILAILGLRALYFVLADWASRLRYLKPGLAAVLLFVGAKMLLSDVVSIPSWVSLVVIAGILATAAIASWWSDRRSP